MPFAVRSRRKEGDERRKAAMETETGVDESITALAIRVRKLERVMEGLGIEVRTQRLVITVGCGGERILGEVVEGRMAELRVDRPGQPAGEWTSVRMFANPGDETSGLPSGLGLHLWVDGDAVKEFDVRTDGAEWAKRLAAGWNDAPPPAEV